MGYPTWILGLTAGLMATALGCGETLNEPDAASGGAASSTSSQVGSGGSPANGAGGQGTGAGGAVIGEPMCGTDEGAIVVAAAAGTGTVAIQSAGSWTKDIPVPGPPWRVATYVDVYHQLAALWIDPPGGRGDLHAHFMSTFDGSSFESHDVFGWAPLPTAPVLSPGGPYLVGGVAGGTSVAYFDPDASDWHAAAGTIAFDASSAALAPNGDLVLVGLGSSYELCEVSLVGFRWGAVHCHPEMPVATGGEIPVTRPAIVALPDGDMVAIYYPSTTALAATTLHEGSWSVPVTTSSDAIGVSFAAAATPEGHVVAAVVSTAGDVSTIRYTREAGWGTPFAVDQGGLVQQELSAATGICGDDVLVAYSMASTEVHVARVRGSTSETISVASPADVQPDRVSIATRRSRYFP